MPIYEYRCRQCGEISEVLTGISSESVIAQCNHCGSDDVEKIMSVSSFAFSDSERVSGTTCCGREERCDTPPHPTPYGSQKSRCGRY